MGKTVKVYMNRRNDGRFSAEIKLNEWTLNEMRGLVSLLWLNPMSRHIAEELGPALEKEKIVAEKTKGA